MHVLCNVKLCKHISSKDQGGELSILTIPDVVCSRWFLKIRKISRTQWSKRRRVRTWIMYSINIQHLAKIHMTKYDYINQTKMDHRFLIRPNKLRLQNISCMYVSMRMYNIYILWVFRSHMSPTGHRLKGTLKEDKSKG